MNERHMSEVEVTLLYISETRRRAEKTAKELEKDGAEPHLVEALRIAERDLDQVATKLMQRTYFAVPEAQLTLKS